MKKDKKWLKKEIATEMIELEPNRKERRSDVKYQTLRDVAQKIDQLDELQVLSHEENINIVLDDLKEYIKEQQLLSQNIGLAHTSAGNDTHYRQYDYVLECIDEYEPSEDLQNLLVPKQGGLETKIQELIESYKQEEDAYSNPENGWISGFIEDLKNLVEKEPLYHALIKGHDVSNSYDIYWNYDKCDNDVFVSRLYPSHDNFLTEMSKLEWNGLGINDSNADFVKVEG